ncbi:MAG: MotA/TolQ/ExbB proton channel family protein [Limnochordales bacterium]|nr:MotA/TolQ/ExbB proton channel family protein [Limnochordales bacterium]
MLFLTTAGGLIVSILALVISVILEGGGGAGLFSLAALTIVLGGTAGATIMSHGVAELRRLPRVTLLAFGKGLQDRRATARLLLELAELVRRHGVLALEDRVREIKDPYFKQALSMLIDGTDSQGIESFLQTEAQIYREQVEHSAQVFQTAGGYAPTMGIIGTVMGLVHVLGNLSEPDKLGGAIATAFLATFYGVASANLIWLPLANKIRAVAAEVLLYRRMVAEAVLAIQRGEPKMLLEERLALYAGPHLAESADETAEGSNKAQPAGVRSAAK